MQFEPSRSAETIGHAVGFLSSFALATALVTTAYAFSHNAFKYWPQAFLYFAAAVLAVVLAGTGIRRMLR